MGLSSDNMQTLKRLESLAGPPLSIMALAYVHLGPSAPAAHTDGQAAAHAWISPLLCWNVDSVAVTLSHASFFLSCLFFLFAQKNQKFREMQT